MFADEAQKAHDKAVREGMTPEALPNPDILLQSGVYLATLNSVH